MREFWWTGVCQYPGLAKFYLGSVRASTEMEAVRKLEAVALTIFPTAPQVTSAVRGRLILSDADA
jgi:hypothetical protein